MNDFPTYDFWLRLVQLLVAILLFALVGQGAMSVLIRAMGQPPQRNIIDRFFRSWRRRS